MNNVIEFPKTEKSVSERLRQLSEQFRRATLALQSEGNYAEIRIYEDGEREVFIHADTQEAAERLKGLV